MNTQLLSERLKALRERRGWSQDRLATEAGVNVRTIQRIERGDGSHKGDTLQALAAALDVEVTQLYVGLTRDSLATLDSDYVCPYCGSMLIERTFVPHEYGDAEHEVFECGYTQVWTWRPCPTDPRFPKFEDYELHFYKERDGFWFCQAMGKTEAARSVSLNTGAGKSKEDAKVMVRNNYIKIRDGYDATSGKQIEPKWLTRALGISPPS